MTVSSQIIEAWRTIVCGQTFSRVLDKANLISAGDGRCVIEMTVQPEHANHFGTLHGGFTSTLVDVVSSVALASDGKSNMGVSVDLSVSFLNAAPLGEQIVVEARTVKAGRSLAFLDVIISSKNSGKIIATGKHTKFVAK